MMMNSLFLSNNNCSPIAPVFQYDSPVFFTVEQFTNKQYNNKRKHNSTFAIEEQSEDLTTSISKRVRSMSVCCKRTFTDLNKKYQSYKNKEEETAEEKSAVHSRSKRTRTTLLSKGWVLTPSTMKDFNNPTPARVFGNNSQNNKNKEDEEIKSITCHMELWHKAMKKKKSNQSLNVKKIYHWHKARKKK